MKIRTFTELSSLKSFEERFDYLKLGGEVGAETFGYDRVFNQMFYRSTEWRRVRNQIILRDNCCDLGAQDHPILGERIVIHHLNPILLRDIREATPYLLEPEYLVTTVHETHNAIHYGSADLLRRAPAERRAGDTCPWRKQKF